MRISKGVGIAGLVLFLHLTACTEQPEQAIRIGSSPWPGYEPLYLARELGYFDEEEITLFELPSADITMEAFRNHSVDVASLPLDGILELLNDGARLRMILIMDISNGGDAVLAHPDIKQLADIQGKRIAAVNIPLGLYMVSRLLDKAGLERKDIQLKLMSETEQQAHYSQGLADIVITYDPVKTALQKAGMKVIFDSADIPNEIFDVLVVHEEVYNNRRKAVCGVVNQWFKTLAYMQENPAAARAKMSLRLGVSETDFQNMMTGIVIPDKNEVIKMLGGETPALMPAANRLASLLHKEGLVNELVDARTAIDPDFVSCIK
ncbi:MAG: ABC transporter substrate-binding protein [Gammaproteobacteria bacterium]|nr:ABC transporter substrate-binding protein [Gammaproteobacteria bacterium]